MCDSDTTWLKELRCILHVDDTIKVTNCTRSGKDPHFAYNLAVDIGLHCINCRKPIIYTVFMPVNAFGHGHKHFGPYSERI